MRALIVVCCSALLAVSHPALAEDCDASRLGAVHRITETQARLESVLIPYEAAVLSGNMAAFETLTEATVTSWQDLLTAIDQERKRLTALRCPLDSIPNEFALPAGWDTVRDIGAWNVIEVDRSIAMLNHQAGIGRRRPGWASAN
jgi:hypothetical protein